MMESPRIRQEVEPRTQLSIPVPIDIVQVQTTDTTIFTAGDNSDFHVTSLFASNVSGSSDTLSLYIVPSGGSTGASTQILDALAIAANAYEVIINANQQLLLPPGASLVATDAVNDAVNVWGMGYAYQGAYA